MVIPPAYGRVGIPPVMLPKKRAAPIKRMTEPGIAASAFAVSVLIRKRLT